MAGGGRCPSDIYLTDCHGQALQDHHSTRTDKGFKPPVWRRIVVDGNITLRSLHHVFQAAFGWTDSHLHEFAIDNTSYRMLENENVLDFMGATIGLSGSVICLQL